MIGRLYYTNKKYPKKSCQLPFNYITIIIKTTFITITLASVLHYITISTKSHVTEIFFIIIVIISKKT